MLWCQSLKHVVSRGTLLAAANTVFGSKWMQQGCGGSGHPHKMLILSDLEGDHSASRLCWIRTPSLAVDIAGFGRLSQLWRIWTPSLAVDIAGFWRWSQCLTVVEDPDALTYCWYCRIWKVITAPQCCGGSGQPHLLLILPDLEVYHSCGGSWHPNLLIFAGFGRWSQCLIFVMDLDTITCCWYCRIWKVISA